jgi:thiosulfate/3-mercaptopyruvate sulfurtransferase
VSILNGGLQRWLSDGFPVLCDDRMNNSETQYTARRQGDWVCSQADVEEALNNNGIQVVDARSEGRFKGTLPEPRHGLCSGHMIGALNLPYTRLFDKETKTLASLHIIEKG